MYEGGILGRAIANDVYRSAIFEINRRDADLGIVLQHHHECIEDVKRDAVAAKEEATAMKLEHRWSSGIIISILLGLMGLISTKGHP